MIFYKGQGLTAAEKAQIREGVLEKGDFLFKSGVVEMKVRPRCQHHMVPALDPRFSFCADKCGAADRRAP